MKHSRLIISLLAGLAVFMVALALRLKAASELPQDFDEPVYFLAGQHYAAAMLAGDWGEIVDYEYNLEHPPLNKLAYGLALAALPQLEEIPAQPTNPPPSQPYPLPQPHLLATRLTAVLFGALAALALALVNPLAGLFLAFHTFTVKYTSQAYLEALASLGSLVAVIAYGRCKGRWNGWLILAAVALGLTAAAKYLYAVAGIAIVVHWLWVGWQKPAGQGDAGSAAGRRVPALRRLLRWVGPVVAWGLLAVVVFLLASPFLWRDPVGRLQASILFNADFAASEHVRSAGYPPWQPFVWLTMSVPWHPGVFVVAGDIAITLLAIAGLRPLFRQRSIYAVWLVVGLAFLLVWPTKWPQYILVLTAPLCLAAAVGLRVVVWDPYVRWLNGRRETRRSRDLVAGPVVKARSGSLAWRELRRALPWLLPGLLVLSLIALYPMVYQGAMSLTDFSSASIRDGLNGGVWRAVGEGLLGRAEPVAVEFGFSRPSAKEVHWAGPGLFLRILGGGGAPLVVFEVIWTVLAVTLQTGLGLGVALLLNRPGLRFANAWRALFILPWAIPEFVGALIWAQIFEPKFGWLNLAGESFASRIDAPISLNIVARWQEDPFLALMVLLIAATWYGFPFMMLAASAGLKLLPVEVYDAAAIDGADRWQLLRRITWPLLVPLLVPAIIIRAIFTFNQFYLFYVLNTPFPATTFSLASFFFFSEGGMYAVSAAINLATVLVLIGLIFWFDRRSRATEGVTCA